MSACVWIYVVYLTFGIVGDQRKMNLCVYSTAQTTSTALANRNLRDRLWRTGLALGGLSGKLVLRVEGPSAYGLCGRAPTRLRLQPHSTTFVPCSPATNSTFNHNLCGTLIMRKSQEGIVTGGGGVSNSQNQLNSISQQQANTSAQLAGEGQQLINTGQAEQQPLVSFLQSIIGGNSTSTNSAIAQPLGTIANQTNTNREQIYDTTAPGAGRDVLLGQNTLNEGTQVSALKNSTFLQAFPELASLAGGNTSAGLGLTGAGITSESNAASTTGTVLNSQEQQKASTLNLFGSLASAAGQGAGLALGCWIAMAIYGDDDPRTYLVRAYLNGPFCESLLGRIVMTIYLSIGRQLAWFVRRSKSLKALLKPLFDMALASAREWDAGLRRQ